MTAYLVCATQRSGSTLLCEALKATGVAGHPEEFFEARPATGIPPAPLDYLADIGDPYVTGLLADAPPPPAPPYSALDGLGLGGAPRALAARRAHPERRLRGEGHVEPARRHRRALRT